MSTRGSVYYIETPDGLRIHIYHETTDDKFYIHIDGGSGEDITAELKGIAWKYANPN